MTSLIAPEPSAGTLSSAARNRLSSHWGEPLLLADWEGVLMIHFEVDSGRLQHDVPFELDLWEGRAFVSLVAFTLHRMRPFQGGRWSEWLFKPLADHDFLNVRTYVRHRGEPGIHFLREWLSSRLASRLGPATFSLPYRFARISYEHDWHAPSMRGKVRDPQTNWSVAYEAALDEPASFGPCIPGSFDEWLMERYSAFNSAGAGKRFFRVWHEPWRQVPAQIQGMEASLLYRNWPWFSEAQFAGANFSPGARRVHMGRPHRC